ncbi:MAG TPA: hypothetical protein PK605_07005 [Ignavibacteria bacterium]|nr:hypothetical protein [Bacteroidota bacterium]HRE09562.1 hypothetical protein [Ignavibacteria bacterium]HRF64418.1 hypothetical protein [Ignavibacteria bacterium]HRJ04133.1 hypothetical protein [Ignavibacteria bacterium]
MKNSVDEEVIDFTAEYTHNKPNEISDSTILASIGIVTYDDSVAYITNLEDSFNLTYEEGDANGIVIVGDATALIEKKLGTTGRKPTGRK